MFARASNSSRVICIANLQIVSAGRRHTLASPCRREVNWDRGGQFCFPRSPHVMPRQASPTMAMSPRLRCLHLLMDNLKACHSTTQNSDLNLGYRYLGAHLFRVVRRAPLVVLHKSATRWSPLASHRSHESRSRSDISLLAVGFIPRSGAERATVSRSDARTGGPGQPLPR